MRGITKSVCPFSFIIKIPAIGTEGYEKDFPYGINGKSVHLL